MINYVIGASAKSDIYFLSSQVIIFISVVILFTSIIIDFAIFHEKNNTVIEKKSIVETGTMTLFFLAFVIVLKVKMNEISEVTLSIRRIASIIGAVLVFLGAVVNVIGRFNLGDNWANHIKIYKNHKLVISGVYKIVRHPLYGSIMMMFFGSAIAYLNIYCLLLEIIVFIPFMYYRAKQEEVLLTQTFPEYIYYKERTGMFFPKLLKRRS